MKKNSLKVALNMSTLSVPDKIIKARLIVNAIAASPSAFAAPNPALATITTAINELDTAWDDTADNAKSKTAIMHDKEDALMRLLNILANYVEEIASDSEDIVHLAAMDVKRKPNLKTPAEFEVYQGSERGTIGLRVKARVKTMYKWQYCKSPTANNVWVTGTITDVSRATLNGLEVGAYYYFRVVFVNASGEHPSAEIGFAVN